MIETRDIKPSSILSTKERYTLLTDINFERINTFDHVEQVEINLRNAADRSRPLGKRITSFIAAQSKLFKGSKARTILSSVADIVTIFVPYGEQINKVRTVINRKTMPKRFKPFLKKKGTLEGIAAILGAVGITFHPEAAYEIIAGVFLVIAGVEMWKKEPIDE